MLPTNTSSTVVETDNGNTLLLHWYFVVVAAVLLVGSLYCVYTCFFRTTLSKRKIHVLVAEEA